MGQDNLTKRLSFKLACTANARIGPSGYWFSSLVYCNRGYKKWQQLLYTPETTPIVARKAEQMKTPQMVEATTTPTPERTPYTL